MQIVLRAATVKALNATTVLPHIQLAPLVEASNAAQ
jgi:hypothetical protein